MISISYQREVRQADCTNKSEQASPNTQSSGKMEFRSLSWNFENFGNSQMEYSDKLRGGMLISVGTRLLLYMAMCALYSIQA